MTSLNQQFRTMQSGSISDFNVNSNVQSPNRSLNNVAKVKYYFFKVLQFFHFVIVMVFLWAGMVEFINNPPFFDAYGDALAASNKLPEGIFVNDPRQSQKGNLRLMDLPILLILLAYVGVTTWLKFKGLAWLLTASITVAFLFFWIVNFWAQSYFDWRYYSSRMSGLEFQVSALAFTSTNILIVLFYKRRRLPFKFKSSLPLKRLGFVHLLFNFFAIFLIMFTSMLMWFTKMYISWACFKDQKELLEICQITSQVQCYPCSQCSTEGIKECYKRESDTNQFTCNVKYPDNAKGGAFCIFNYNMGAVEFLTIFAYIGGLCVFLSNFIKLVGHYVLRVIFMLYEWVLHKLNKTSATLKKHRERLVQAKILKERRLSADRQILTESLSPRDRELVNGSLSPNEEGTLRDMDIEDGIRDISPIVFDDEDDDDNDNFLNASCG